MSRNERPNIRFAFTRLPERALTLRLAFAFLLVVPSISYAGPQAPQGAAPTTSFNPPSLSGNGSGNQGGTSQGGASSGGSTNNGGTTGGATGGVAPVPMETPTTLPGNQNQGSGNASNPGQVALADTALGISVTGLFQRVLGRKPSAIELQNRVKQLQNSRDTRLTMQQMEREFLASKEYYRIQVNTLYEKYLRRRISEDGLQKLFNAKPRPTMAEVERSLINSEEYKRLKKDRENYQHLYKYLLKRDISPKELTELLKKQPRPELYEVREQLETSEEFYRLKVKELYKMLLHRDITPYELTELLKQQRRPTLAEVQQQLMTTDEHYLPGVKLLYKELLNREISKEELTKLLKQQRRPTLYEVEKQLETTDEYYAAAVNRLYQKYLNRDISQEELTALLKQQPRPTLYEVDEQLKTTDKYYRLYKELFNRDISQEELTALLKQQPRPTLYEVEKQLTTTDEYYAAAVNRLYQELFNRDISQEELTALLKQQPRPWLYKVRAQFKTTDEYYLAEVKRLSQKYLKRDISQDELTALLKQQPRPTLYEVEEQLKASDEYYTIEFKRLYKELLNRDIGQDELTALLKEARGANGRDEPTKIFNKACRLSDRVIVQKLGEKYLRRDISKDELDELCFGTRGGVGFGTLGEVVQKLETSFEYYYKTTVEDLYKEYLKRDISPDELNQLFNQNPRPTLDEVEHSLVYKADYSSIMVENYVERWVGAQFRELLGRCPSEAEYDRLVGRLVQKKVTFDAVRNGIRNSPEGARFVVVGPGTEVPSSCERPTPWCQIGDFNKDSSGWESPIWCLPYKAGEKPQYFFREHSNVWDVGHPYYVDFPISATQVNEVKPNWDDGLWDIVNPDGTRSYYLREYSDDSDDSPGFYIDFPVSRVQYDAYRKLRKCMLGEDSWVVDPQHELDLAIGQFAMASVTDMMQCIVRQYATEDERNEFECRFAELTQPQLGDEDEESGMFKEIMGRCLGKYASDATGEDKTDEVMCQVFYPEYFIGDAFAGLRNKSATAPARPVDPASPVGRVNQCLERAGEKFLQQFEGILKSCGLTNDERHALGLPTTVKQRARRLFKKKGLRCPTRR